MTQLLKTSLLGTLATFFLSGVATAVLSASASAQDSTNRNQDVVEMEKLEVSADRYKWLYTRMGDFEILTTLDDTKTTRDIIHEALQIINVFKANSPLFNINHELPVRIVLVKDYGTGNLITTVDENEKAGVETGENSPAKEPLIGRTTVAPMKSGKADPDKQMPCLIKNTDEQAQIIMSVPKAYRGMFSHEFAVSSLVDAYFKLCFSNFNKKYYNLFYTFSLNKILSIDFSERFMFRSADNSGEYLGPGTTWTWYSYVPYGVRIQRHDYKIERLILQTASKYAATHDDKSGDGSLPNANVMAAPALSLRDVLEHPDMFRAIRASDKFTLQAVEDWTTYKREISDFSIYCVFSPDAQIRAGYVKLLNALDKSPLNEDLFTKCFGRDYADFHNEMYAFYRNLGKDKYTGEANAWGVPSFTVPTPNHKIGPFPKFRNATRSERTRIFGEWFLACDEPDLARKTYDKAQKQDLSVDKDPEFLASLGLYEANAGDKTKALALLEKAAALGTTRPAVFRMLANLRQGTPLPPAATALDDAPDSE